MSNIFKISPLVTFLLIQSFLVFAQSGKQDEVKLLDGFQFAFKLSNGFNTTQSQEMSGASKLTGGLVHQHAFNVEGIQYLGSKGIFVALNLGFGINGFAYKTSTNNELVNSAYFRYYDKLEAFPFLHADAGIGYASQINNRWIFRSQLKIGVRSSALISNYYGFSDINGTIMEYELESHNTWHSILRGESGIGYTLKNHDILELGVFYTYTNSSVYTGTYTYYSDNSTGSFLNYGRELGLTLNYIFSGYSRRSAISARSTPGLTLSEKKTNFRIERRKFQPGSWLLGLRIGLHAARFKPEPNSVLMSGSVPDLHFGINFNYNPTQNTFWEGDISNSSYDEVTITKYGTSSSFSSGDYILGLSAGWGYRIIGRNNYNWLSVSGGVGVNFVGNQRGTNGYSRFKLSRNGIVLVDVMSTTSVLHRTYPILYLGLSKDFRLGVNSFISLAYRHTEGFYPIVQQKIQSSGQDVVDVENFNSNFRGASNTFGIGYKQRFNN